MGFPTTCWDRIAAAKDPASPLGRDSITELCANYWYPVCTYIRRRGHGPEMAEDLTQEFFARLLKPGALDSVDPRKGRFRTFLLASCNHFLSDRRKSERAMKRGGGRRPIPIDLVNAEGRYSREPSHELTPERLFERRWALTLIDRAHGRLAAESGRSTKAALFGSSGFRARHSFTIDRENECWVQLKPLEPGPMAPVPASRPPPPSLFSVQANMSGVVSPRPARASVG